VLGYDLSTDADGASATIGVTFVMDRLGTV